MKIINGNFSSCRIAMLAACSIAVAAWMIPASAQVNIEQCQAAAAANYPLVQQYGLIERSAEYTISNANRGYLPQIALSARATHQSDVTELPIKLPMVNIEPMSKNQYQASAEASQVLWDGGLIRAQKKNAEAAALADRKKLDADLFSLRDRVNQLFFGILLIDEQLAQNDILRKELQTSYDRVASYVANGVANQSDLDAVHVELLNSRQARTAIEASGNSFRAMLAALTGTSQDALKKLVRPACVIPDMNAIENKRPELQYFQAQSRLYDTQKNSVYASAMPKIGAFIQGSYGKPGLNMFNTEPSPSYIGGIKATWNISSFYTQGNNLAMLEIAKKAVEVQKETFLFNSRLSVIQQQNEIEKIRRQIEGDDEIIALRRSIKTSAEAKVENGTLSVSDLVREINAENLALQQKSLHEIQLLTAIYTLKNLTNN